MGRLSAVVVLFVAAIAGRALADEGNVRLPRFPALSPDGSSITFSWRGDLWLLPIEGGLAKRLTVHPNDDLESAWSPDGGTIAFTSTRDGGRNLFLMNSDGSHVQQVTQEDNGLSISGWSSDGKFVLSHSFREGDVYREARPYLIATDGSEIKRLNDAFGSEPAMSPDGKWVAFTRGNANWDRRGYRGADQRDVWLYSTERHTFHRVTDWPGNDGMAKWAGNGSLVFVSDRDFNTNNLFTAAIAADGSVGEARRLTHFNGKAFGDGVWTFDVSRNGRRVVLHAWDGLYAIDLASSAPVAERLTVRGSEDLSDRVEIRSVGRDVTEAAMSPDGKTMAFVAYGEIFVQNIEDSGRPTRRVTDSPAHDRQIAWSPCGTRLYFSSDRDGSFSIYAATVASTRSEVREQFDQATKPVEEEPAADEPAAEPSEESGHEPGDEPASTESGDGASPGAGAADEPVSDEPAEEKAEQAKPEAPKKKPEIPDPGKRWQDALSFNIEPIVVTQANEFNPSPSPDGNLLAYRRTRGDLMILDLRTGETKPLFEHWDGWIGWAWAPDSRHIAFNRNDENFNAEIFITPIDGSWEPVNITKHPGPDYGPSFSADGKVLAFQSSRIDRESDVWLVFLDKSIEAMTSWEQEKYFEEAAKEAGKRKPIKVPDWLAKHMGWLEDEPEAGDGDEKDAEKKDEAEKEAESSLAEAWSLDDAYLRLRRLTSLPGSEGNVLISGGGDRVVFTGSDGGSGLFSVDWKGQDRKRLTGSASVQHLGVDGKTLVLVQGSQAVTVAVTGGSTKTHSINPRIRVDLAAQSSQKFNEAARFMNDTFYHPTMKGLDWQAITERYHDLAAHAITASEFSDVANRLLGELNASHMGIRPPGERAANAQSNGRLGVDSVRVSDGYAITRVLDGGPADQGAMKLLVGDVVLAVNGESVVGHATLAAALRGLTGEEVVLTVRRTPKDGGSPFELPLLITPISYGAEVNLRYDQWQYDNARKVHEWSGGRLGYIHIRAMSGPALNDFERDLYAAGEGRDGLLIDVRNNGGGSTADRVLASLMVQPHAYTVPRGDTSGRTDAYPQDRLYIQRYIKPVNMLCNQKSYSNAEIISHAFKTLGRGTLVGQETYGAVISTGGVSLLDGTTVRMPFRGWYLPDGRDMDVYGAVPDLIVPQTPEDEAADEDRQLRAAVEDLLKRL